MAGTAIMMMERWWRCGEGPMEDDGRNNDDDVGHWCNRCDVMNFMWRKTEMEQKSDREKWGDGDLVLERYQSFFLFFFSFFLFFFFFSFLFSFLFFFLMQGNILECTQHSMRFCWFMLQYQSSETQTFNENDVCARRQKTLNSWGVFIAGEWWNITPCNLCTCCFMLYQYQSGITEALAENDLCVIDHSLRTEIELAR